MPVMAIALSEPPAPMPLRAQSSPPTSPPTASSTIIYACADCNKTFAHRGSLNRHCDKYHEGRQLPRRRRSTLAKPLKPFKCLTCVDARFTTREGLRTHLLRHKEQDEGDDIDYAPTARRAADIFARRRSAEADARKDVIA